ncbi:MAG: T9SS type A sorting domain-containing protein [Bacteroidetes bacterium]|nr:T9SS type A sorting domain-containing protein [Bacteroidota bacterium]
MKQHVTFLQPGLCSKILFAGILMFNASYLSGQHYIDRYLTSTPVLTEVGNSSNQINNPTDLDVKPGTNEIWVCNSVLSGGSVVIFYDAGLPSQISQFRKDSHSSHFMPKSTSLAFAENGEFATTQDVLTTNSGAFMGPTLWSGDTSVYANVFQNPWMSGLPMGSHLSMLHQSPYSVGIAHDTAKVYWLLDAQNNTICKYDFVQGHGPGYDDHSDGIIWRYTDVTFTRKPNLPSHLVLDKSSGWLYYIDGGQNKLKRLNTNTGAIVGNLTPPPNAFEVLDGYYDVQGAVVELVDSMPSSPMGIDLYNGRLIVSNYNTGDIRVYDITGAVPVYLGVISTGQPGIAGVKIAHDGKIWFVNYLQDKLYRIDIPAAANDIQVLSIQSPRTTNSTPDYYSIGFNVCNATVAPAVFIRNAGTDTLTSAVISYSIDNQPAVSFNWSGSLGPDSVASVALPASTIADGAHLIRVVASQPNGLPDENPANDSKRGSFRSMGTTLSYPYAENFDTTYLPAGWHYVHYNPNSELHWSSAGGFGLSTGSVKMDNYSSVFNNSGQNDYLMMPAIDLSAAPASGTSLEFSVAHARFNASATDRLQVKVSTDCGVTWFNVYNKAGATLATVNTFQSAAFTPSAQQWRTESINLTGYAGMSDVRFMFIFTSGSGNNIYIDDIRINNSTVNVEEPLAETGIQVMPNPGNGLFNLHTGNTADVVNVVIYNLLGETVYTVSATPANGNMQFDLSAFPAGTYMLKVRKGDAVYNKRIQLVH